MITRFVHRNNMVSYIGRWEWVLKTAPIALKRAAFIAGKYVNCSLDFL